MNTTTTTIEALEGRQMMSASSPLALTVSSVVVDGGLQLQVTGTAKSDNIGVSPATGGLTVTNGKWSQTIKGDFKSVVVKAGNGDDNVTISSKLSIPAFLYGGAGNDTLNGGAGNDNLYGQAGTDVLNGNGGDDTLVTVGDSTMDRSSGGAGFDSFWSDTAKSEKVTDASADEIVKGAVHQVGSFFSYGTMKKGQARTNKVGLDLNGENLADPMLDDDSATYKNFSNNPLFSSTGPSADDINQGYIGDCWFLSTIASMAKTNPNSIRQSVSALGDGTFAVQFVNADGTKAFVRVDGDLPTSAWGGMQYAGLGKQNCTWVAIMEKAYTCFRDHAAVANYANLDGGWMSEAFSDLGYDNSSLWDVSNANDLMNQIANELKAGKAVTMAILNPTGGAPVIGSHAYTVVAVETNKDGSKTLVLRNPWGIDGVGNDGKNDGYVRLTAAQAYGSFWGVISANVG